MSVALMRLRCTRCKGRFSQTYEGQRRCARCQKYAEETKLVLQRTVDELRQQLSARTAHDEALWTRWLVKELEPWLGDPRVNPIIQAMLGRKTGAA